ncbi:MAG: hypothetical protein DI636_02470 [Pelagerythrobacter marensis]|nr:MAG: hypothetical protein DI636_02470 [Pelagerythrobacter marensis]PZU16710.1 MAG: hypothetical protein DI591_05745 [Citromicrobium sp.]
MADTVNQNDIKTEAKQAEASAATVDATAKKPVEATAAPATKTTVDREPAARTVNKRKPAARKRTAAAGATPKEPKMTQTTNNANDFQQTVAEAGADVQNRVRAAYERSTEMTGDMTEFAKGNVEAMVASGRILAAGVQDFARSEIEAVKSAYETMTDDMRQMAAVKSPAELLQLQSEIMRRNFDAMIKHGSKNTENMVRLANDAFAPLSNRMSLAAEKVARAA